jgi:uncharacterized OB-fold protein
MSSTPNGLRLFTCSACAHVFQIARGFCPRCGGTTLTSSTKTRQGIVTACTKVHVTPLGSPTGDVPFWIVLVQTDDGPVIMATSAKPLPIGAQTTLTAQSPDHGPYMAET